MSATAGRTDYDKWSKVTKSLLEETEEDERREREAASESLGHTRVSYSRAEEEERIKAAAAKNAKEALDKFRENESNAIAVVDKVPLSADSPFHEVTNDSLGGKRVVSVRNNRGPGTIVLPEALSSLTSTSPSEGCDVRGVVKVFVEDCRDCTVRLECKIVTSTLEIANCSNLRVEIVKERVATLQIDLCDGVEVVFTDQGCFGKSKEDKIYHAGVSNMRVRIMDGERIKLSSKSDYLADGAVPRLNATAEEYQFVTSVVDNQLSTKPVSKTEPTSDDDRSELRKETVERCAKRKEEGNEAFRAGEYAQAVLFYSMCVDDADGLEAEEGNDDDDDDSSSVVRFEERHVVLANRAACFLKLGRHDRALEDAEACLEAKPGHVKGLFRKGLALHATGRYREAIDALAEAQRTEPKNKQIAQALKFAEVKLTMETRKRMEV